MFCTKCGAERSTEDRHCRKCGALLPQVTERPSDLPPLIKASEGTDVYSQEFKNRQSAQWWYNKASQLHASAAVIWYFGVTNKVSDSTKNELGFPAGVDLQVGCAPVFPLLCGLALETLLKSIIVLSGGQPESSHDLVKLAGNAMLDLDEALKKNLCFLSRSVIWDGKYPVPKKEDYLRSYWMEYSDISMNWSWVEYRKIWDRFADEFLARQKGA